MSENESTRHPGESLVVDVGCRAQESIDMFLPYLDDDEPAKRIVGYAVSPLKKVYSGHSALPFKAYKRTTDDGKKVASGSLEDEFVIDDVSKMLDEQGIDSGIVNPTLNLGLSEVNNSRFAVSLARGYNEWLVDNLDEHENVKGNLLISHHEPEKAAEEIDRFAGESDIVGIQFPATGIAPPPGKKAYNPIYEAAERHGLPISMHSTVGIKSYSQQFSWDTAFAETWTYYSSFEHIRNLTSLLYEGVPVRFPDIKFVFQGGGIGYVPYTIQRLDDHYLELGYEIPILEQLPSKYIEDTFYWLTEPLERAETEPEYVKKMMEMIRPENVMFSSDIPHPHFDTPSITRDRLTEHFDEETVDDVMGGTAKEVFGL